LGRVDEQVKIRGYRIEPAEIEAVLQQCELVSQGVVLAREDKQGNKKLVGYVVAEGAYDKEGILSYLRDKLPEYMVPALLVELESLPLTANGKVDRKALPDPNGGELLSGQYVAPRNETEIKLADIWQHILEVDQVGIHNDFFELGGHSLLAVRLISAIRKEFVVEIPISDVFIYPTIAGLGEVIDKENSGLDGSSVNIKYLVPLKTGSQKKAALYIVCGGGGTALRFKEFAEMLDEDQSVFVLQPPVGSKDLKEFPDKVEGIAHKFIEEILVKNPDGPYALSGHCTGGIIAFEMARQLEAMGKKIHLLAMFDSIIRKREKRESAKFKNFYNLPVSLRRFISKVVLKFDFEVFLLRKHTRKAIEYKVKSFKSLMKKFTKEQAKRNRRDYDGLEIFHELSEISRLAIRKYKVIPYDGEVILFYAKERYYFTDVSDNIRFKKVYLNDNAKNMWRQYATSVSIYEVEGDHSDMFETIHGNKFAMLLQQQLNKPVK
ncbi:MAG: amino acid adenylation protein, partial [Segetibacter sp.]|nr:amino acid adenylation protein [Segetibacter sp.]